VSILIPCFNEEKQVAETIRAAMRQNWPHFEVIAVNDGSRDDTGELLDRLAAQHAALRVIHLPENQGKAMALRMGALAARGEYLVCIDCDAMMHPNATAWLIAPMLRHPRVGAVTGNPRVRTRMTLIGRIQVGEYSSIIGLIKRAQRIYGNIFTVSGVIAAFRRRALHDCGYWNLNAITEDIDISWSLQMRHWQIQYQPCAIVWILMPETLLGLWKQRLRWAQGGAETFIKNLPRLLKWRNRRTWLLIVEFCLSYCWAYGYLLSILLWGLGKYVVLPAPLQVTTLWPPAFWGMMLATVNLMQLITALLMETRYDHKFIHLIVWMIWYPMVFWALSLLTTAVALPKAMLRAAHWRAVWETKDRGFR
jgi:biofilm PGA synthesis N-glycosyltransferase PgaC